MELISEYSVGVHLDFSDGIFTPHKLLPISKAFRIKQLITHAHIMYKNPLVELKNIIKLGADLVILHAESDNVVECLERLQSEGVRTGVALLSTTATTKLKEFDGLFDHVLVFGGTLGSQGGQADLNLLEKVQQIKGDFPDAEIAWDGGINDTNVAKIASAGASILNVGGYLKNSDDPKKAYAALSSLVS